MKRKILLLIKAGIKFENMIKDYLGREGFEVEVAESVAEVFYRLRRSPHALLLVEQDTYEMDCLELFLNVRDIQANIHVVFLGSKDQKNKEDIVRLGGVYLDSPVQAEELKGTIRELSKLADSG